METPINIVQLPQETLVKIFRMISYRQPLLSVCKSFNEAICTVEQSKHKMNIIRYTNNVRMQL